MAGSGLLQRLFFGTRMQSTEAMQQQIRVILDGLGSISAQQLYAKVEAQAGPAHTQMMVDQAAQILVNTRIVVATRNQSPVDPVNAGGDYQLAYPKQKDISR